MKEKQAPKGKTAEALSKISPAVKQGRQKAFPIACLGGSAGSLAAIKSFFTHMPPDSDVAFVVVLHLDPDHKGHLANLLGKYTPMPVMEAEDGMAVEPNSVYIIPPDKDMGIHNRKLLLLPAAKPNGYRLPIDYFLQSLAEDQWNKAVGIIFSGMGSDGETGLRMIKEKLGMAMVQDPETAEYDSMPRASIATNLIDYVLAPEEMPIKLIQYLNHPALTDEDHEHLKSEKKDANAIQKILMLLRSHTGHDFAYYKKNTITRRIDRRLAYHQLPDYAHYIIFLRENPHEIDVLFNELLIGVTKFFRDSLAFDALQEKLHALLRDKKTGEPVRIWVAGCSTGEEAYSIAMLVMEFFDATKPQKAPKVQIFATDLDQEAIEMARAGTYFENIVADISPERLGRFFIKTEGTYTVKKELREMVVFAQHNLIKDAPFTKLDLLACRNVMIYFTGDLQKKIIPIFHYSLNPKGILFMGPAESIGGFTELFGSIDAKWKMFERKEGSSIQSKVIDFPFNVSPQPGNIYKTEDPIRITKKITIAENFNKILLENYTPASLLINEKGDVLYINGKTSKFLELNAGEATMNIHQLAKEELRYALSNAIHQARAQKTTITINDLRLKDEDRTRLATIKVTLMQENALQGLVLVVLEDKGIVEIPVRAKKTEQNGRRNPLVEELEKELLFTKQQLHTTIEQMETSLEELKSTNEELQSTNEELQSTNEESLTTKEEMQSLNEELMTINTQFQAKAEELTQLNNDMKNLLDNTEIGTIFLDNRLVILRFTPQVKKLFNVLEQDIGRAITDIVFNFDFPDLENTIKDVIETLIAKETEIKTKKGEWYNLRIIPYRTLDNFINGAVLTFTNITRFKGIENKMNAVLSFSKAMLDTVNDPALILNHQLHITNINSSFGSYFHIKEQDIIGVSITAVAHEHWKTSKLDKALKHIGNEELSFPLSLDFPEMGSRNMIFKLSPCRDKETGELIFVLLVVREKGS